jgi:hypothetical protein
VSRSRVPRRLAPWANTRTMHDSSLDTVATSPPTEVRRQVTRLKLTSRCWEMSPRHGDPYWIPCSMRVRRRTDSLAGRADAGGRVRFRSSVARGRRRAVRSLGLDSPAGARVGGTTGVTIAFRGSAVCVFQWRFGMPAAGTYDPRDFFRSGSVTPTHLRQEPIVTSAVCNFDSADVLGGCGASGGERDAPV